MAKHKNRNIITPHHEDEKKRNKTDPSLYNEIPNRNVAAIITQLRTGRCGLNLYLHHFGFNESPYCKCGYGKENVEHYLMECRNYKKQRKKLLKDVGTGKMKMEILLGDPSMIKHTMIFINATRRLEK